MTVNKGILRAVATGLAVIALTATVAAKANYLSRYGIHEDVDMVLTPAKHLVRDGNLRHAAWAMPWQVVRDWKDPAQPPAFPFWFNYLGPVLYFAPFVAWFGGTTVLPFAVGQTVLLVAVVAAFLAAYRGVNTRLQNLCLATLLVLCLSGSFYASPTQLFLVLGMIPAWRYRRQLLERPLLLGALLGLVYQFRPEALALGGALFVGSLFEGLKPLRLIRQWCLAGVAFVALAVAAGFLRKSLGAVPGTDHNLYILGVRVLEPGWGVMFSSRVHEASELLKPGAVALILRKIWGSVYSLLSGRHFLSGSLAVGLLLSAALAAKAGRAQAAGLAAVLTFFALTFVLLGLGEHVPRYFEPVGVLLVLFAAEHLKAVPDVEAGSAPAAVAAMAMAAVAAMQLLHIRTLDLDREGSLRRVAAGLREAVPADARVLIRHPVLWNWYADGRYAVMHNNTAAVDDATYGSYRPDALVLFVPGEAAPERRAFSSGPAPEPRDAVRDLRLLRTLEFGEGEGVRVYTRAAAAAKGDAGQQAGNR